jgi:hypothetical protein
LHSILGLGGLGKFSGRFCLLLVQYQTVMRKDSNILWKLQFEQKLFDSTFVNENVQDETNWNVFELSVRFLALGTEINNGTIILTINSKFFTNTISHQWAQNHKRSFPEILEKSNKRRDGIRAVN